jgi:alpha-amylase
MADWLELELGQRPRGLWLTERVWEPSLAATLRLAGVEYTAVDDAHFVAAGLGRDQLWGTYQTEDQGLAVRVFPIHRELRYAIPFGAPEDTIALLRRVSESHENGIAVLGDDGEKFGVWPGTHRLCYQEGWLDRFADALEANPWIELSTPAEAIAHHPPLGLVYLPTASYHEMQEWSLPPEGQARYGRAAERLKPTFGDETHDLLRGGLWRNFQARYPEAGRPHQRVQRASRKLALETERDGEAWKAARTHLWRAECNDVYWHGVFGGLYLPHLRAAIYRELIAVEAFLSGEAARTTCEDLDLDGFADAVLENRNAAVWLGARGGAMWGFDDRRRLWNYGDTLARRPEAYHARLKEAVVGGAAGKTIHGAIRLKEPGLVALVQTYDARGRESFLDRWSEAGMTHDWGNDRFEIENRGVEGVTLRFPEAEAPALEKQFVLAADGSLEVRYQVSSARARAGTLAIELNLGLHVPRADDRFVEVEGRRAEPSHFAARARHDRVTRCAFVDGWADRRLDIACDPPAVLDRAPIETVSLSEAGAERVFQGVEASFRFEVAVAPDSPSTLRFVLRAGAAAGAEPEAHG